MCFVIAFILGHMIPIPDKHKVGLRTAVMTAACLFAVSFHNYYFDHAAANAQAKAAGIKNLYLVGFTLVFSAIAMILTPGKQKTG